MNVPLFLSLANHLLKTHFGVNIGDTPLSQRSYHEPLINDGQSMAAHLNKVIEDQKLHRPGMSPGDAANHITQAEFYDALGEIGGIVEMDEDPVKCAWCGTRTDFRWAKHLVSQHHSCPSCGHEFIVEACIEASV